MVMETRKSSAPPREVLHRHATLDRASVDADQRTAAFSFSSEEPVERVFGFEILDHGSGSVRLGRLNDGGPVLLNHDTDRQIGVVESAAIDGERKGRVVARFSRSAEATDVLNDIVDGIRRNVSVGYRIHAMEPDESNRADGAKSFRITDWEPLEVSIVSVAADATVGVGRNDGEQLNLVEVSEMADDEKPSEENRSETETAPESAQDKPSNVIDIRSERDAAVKRERERVREINAIASQHSRNTDIQAAARAAVESGVAWDEFGRQALEILGRESKHVPADETPVTELGLSNREVEQYSLLRAIRAMAAQSELGTPISKNAPYEHKVSLELLERLPADRQETVRGMLIPWDVQQRWLPSQKRAAPMDTSENSHLVGTDHLAGSFIDALRARAVCMEAGARSLTGLVGDVSIPRLDTPATWSWLAEDGSVTAGEQVTGAVTLSPKTVAGAISVTRRLVKQSSPDVEMLIRDDLVTGAAIEIDAKALTGSGASNQPTGVINVAGIATSTIGSAGNPTFAEFVEFETDLAAANALRGSLAYVMHPTVIGNAKVKVVDSGSGRFVVEGRQDGGGLVGNGYPVFGTTNAGANGIIFGNWSELMIGFWGVLDVMVDPFTDGAKGGLVIRAFQDIDIGVRHAASFSKNA